MKARLPKEYTMSMNDKLKQIQTMQENIEKEREIIESTEFEATAGGGAITVIANGKKELVSVKIKPEIVDPEDIEMLEDLFVAASNEALRNAEDAMEEAVNKHSAGLNIPGMPNLF